MKNASAFSVSAGIGMLFARIPLGTAVALAGYRKIHDLGVKTFVESNLSSVPDYMPSWFAKPYLTAVPWAEASLGVLIVLGLFTRVSGFLAAAMLTSFAMAVSGFFNKDLSPLPLTNPAIYACLGALLLFAGPGKISLDSLLFRGKSR